MADYIEDEESDTLEVVGDTKSSARILAAIKKAERSLSAWQGLCDTIDDIYGRAERYEVEWVDPEYDLFWASMEIMKPAVYAKPPLPVVSPQFKDRRKLPNLTAELLERTVISAFDRGNVDEAMLGARDDLIFYGRGQIWLTYETDKKGGGQRVCIEHVDRKDYLQPPARKDCEVPWKARRAWMTKREMRSRFRKTSGDAYMDAVAAKPQTREDDGAVDHSKKVGVWELWHKADNRVYWVAEGVSVLLDEGEPHLKLSGFFPCPKPAYGTLRPRTLVPVPDYVRYAGHFKKINSLTSRIYKLLDRVRMKGLIAAGGDVGSAVEALMAEDTDATMLIPVPGAALSAAGQPVTWIPLAEIAQAITGLIEARRELFSDFDRLSGISDIMRGETEADETYGAQRLKSQYGSVRVREKIDELQRLARDVTQIAAEIMAENFSQETLLEMSQMEVPTKADIKRSIAEIEAQAKDELEEARKAVEQHPQQPAQGQPGQPPAQGAQPDPQQQFAQATQQIVAKYSQQLQQVSEQVPIEDVMKLLRDNRARGFAFEIATDSTVLTDEMAEKQSRNEFLTVFSTATRELVNVASLGPQAAKLSGEILKFVLQPYRAGRELNGVIDEFIDAAPQMAAQASGGSGEAEKAIAEANQKLAEAELQKAQAATAKVQVDAQGRMQDIQLRAAEAQAKSQSDQQKMQLDLAKAQEAARSAQEKNAQDRELMQAQINKLTADTAAILASIGLDARKQDLEEYAAVNAARTQQAQTAIAAQGQHHAMAQSERDAAMGERQQEHMERQGERAEMRADRQQSLAERQAEQQEA